MRKWKIWLPIGACVLICVVSAGILLQRPSHELPKQATVAASDFFRVYYYDKTIPADFTLVEKSTSFAGGTLTFQLSNTKKQKVTIVEQSLPKELTSSEVFGGDKIDGASGSATVSFKENRVIAVLLTKDKQTMITLNSSDNIDTATLKDLVRGLRPL